MTEPILKTRAGNYIVSTIYGAASIGPKQYETMVFEAAENPWAVDIKEYDEINGTRCDTLKEAIETHVRFIRDYLGFPRPERDEDGFLI